MKNKIFKIACVQHAYKGTVDKTVAHAENEIVCAAAKGAKIICLQELFYIPYFCRTIDNSNFSYAVAIPSGLTDRFSALAKKHKIFIILPVFEKTIEGIYYNTAVIINEHGKIEDIYRKIHIPLDPSFYEKYYFREGDLGYRVINTPYGKIGILICWDQWFPEAARTLALAGAEIIFYPTAIGILKGEEKLKTKFMEAWMTIQRSHAVANGIYIASVNRTGKEKNLDFWGNSFVTGPFGEIISENIKQSEKSIIAEIDLSLIKETRQTWPFLRDRKTGTYNHN